MDYRELLEKVRKTVAEVAQFVREEAVKNPLRSTELKSLNNLVTATDKESERRLIAGLSALLPGSVFLAEEATTVHESGEFEWIIDPIDGTTNFVHGIPAFAISVALRRREEIVLAVVHEINLEEQFYAFKGGGAFVNGRAISVSSAETLQDSVIATGFPYDDFHREDEYWKALRSFTHRTRGLRRLGSAATDLCYVACGRFDAFFEYSLAPWDVAGGAFIVQEAGGTVTDFNNGGQWLFGQEIIASNGKIHGASLEVIREHF